MKEDNGEFNLVVKSVVSIRKIVSEITDEKTRILNYHNAIFDGIEEAGSRIATKKDIAVIWIQEKKEITSNTDSLQLLLDQLFNKLKEKDADGLSQLWVKGKNYADIINSKFIEMEKFGEVVFIGKDLEQWDVLWKKISNNLTELMNIAETIHLKLLMIEKLEPEEIDELTNDIVKHIPLDYSPEEVEKYEKEYLQAYKELKEEASKKKNLWDKFLDILAGGVQETPAHRVMLRRWMDGDNK